MFGASHQINPDAPVSAAANRAQLATAVSDATCTGSSDLAGIYFAVQASYEQQIVNANQQALTTAAQQYRTAYAKELKNLPSLIPPDHDRGQFRSVSARDHETLTAPPVRATLTTTPPP